jgi:S-sulfo-L-cysteine synthase (3-phospho-L-serine-dependent)
MIHANFVDALALPRIVWLRSNLVGLAFPLMKLLPARFILRRAEEAGEIGPGSVIAESTSGTFGMALAMVARLKGYRLTLVSDPAIDAPLQRRLQDLGATVHILTRPAISGGFQRARLDFLQDFLEECPGSFWPRQYSNPCNPESYAQCAEDLVHAIGSIDCLVGTVGSGGSVCGLSSYLRLLFPEMNVIGVDTHGSVIFGLSDAGAGRVLRGLGNSLVPPIVDHMTFDWVHWVGAAEALQATRRLHQEHTLFMGPTSGAAYLVADWWARKNPSALVAVILPDEGHRYVDTVYDDAWLEKKGISIKTTFPSPVECDRPQEGSDCWSYYRWRRRSYAGVMGQEPPNCGLELVR